MGLFGGRFAKIVLVFLLLAGIGVAFDGADLMMGIFSIKGPKMSELPDPWPYPPTRKVESKKYELVDTELKCSSDALIFFWVSNDKFIATVFEDPDKRRYGSKRQVVLVDTKSGKYETLFKDSAAVCWNPDKRITTITLPMYTFTEEDRQKRKKMQLKFDIEGGYKEIALNSEADTNCSSIGGYKPQKPKGAYLQRLKEKDGYLAYSERDLDAPAKLFAPNKPPKDIGITSLQVHNISTLAGVGVQYPYLDYFEKYFFRTAYHSYDAFASNYLMSADGEIEYIPYPKILFEYGIKRETRDFMPTPHGLLINATQEGYALFLLKGEKLYKIYGGNGFFDRGSEEWIKVETISPDGCMVVFAHSKRMYETNANIGISILNLCKEVE